MYYITFCVDLMQRLIFFHAMYMRSMPENVVIKVSLFIICTFLQTLARQMGVTRKL